MSCSRPCRRGPVHAARLTAALGSDRNRGSRPTNWSPSPASLPSSSAAANSSASVGVTSVPSSFAKLHEFAAQSIQDSFWARAYYSSQRAKGKDHHAAVRALAFKWIRIIWKCWHSRTPYNEVIYLESCGRRDRRCSSSRLTIRSEYSQ